MQLVNDLERSVQEQLERHGFVARADKPSSADIAMSVPTAAGDWEIRVQVKTASRPSLTTAAERQEHRLASSNQATTMMAEPYISARRGKALRAQGTPYVDAAGNMWLELPGLYILVEGRPAPPGLPKGDARDRLSRPSSLRITFALLTQPQLLQATLRELAEQCGTSVGAAQAATADLAGSGYLSGVGARRRLTRTAALADRWVFDYGTRLLPKLDQAAFHGPAPAWWIASNSSAPSGAALGGEAACELLGYPIRAVDTLLYGNPPWGSIRKIGRLSNDGDATVILRERFWPTRPDAPAIAPSLLIYADLALEDDPRLREMSRQMRRDDDDLRRLWPT